MRAVGCWLAGCLLPAFKVNRTLPAAGWSLPATCGRQSAVRSFVARRYNRLAALYYPAIETTSGGRRQLRENAGSRRQAAISRRPVVFS